MVIRGPRNGDCPLFPGIGPFDDRRYPAISAPVECLDVGGRLRVVAQGLPQDTDCLGERRIRDESILPDAVHQLLAEHNIAGAAQQNLEHPRHARRQGELRPILFQHPAGGVEYEWPEGYCWRRHENPRLGGSADLNSYSNPRNSCAPRPPVPLLTRTQFPAPNFKGAAQTIFRY